MNHAVLKAEFDQWFTTRGQSDIVLRIEKALSNLSIDELREERLRAMRSDEGYWVIVHSNIIALTRDLPPFWTDKAKFDDEEYRSSYSLLKKELSDDHS